jgi:hypothetical protein
MPLGFHPHPGGMFDNSPTFQSWVTLQKRPEVPKGRPSPFRASAVPSGLFSHKPTPNVETLGYCRMSLRDSGTGCGHVSQPGFVLQILARRSLGPELRTFNVQLPTTKSKRQWVQAAFFLPNDPSRVVKEAASQGRSFGLWTICLLSSRLETTQRRGSILDVGR